MAPVSKLWVFRSGDLVQHRKRIGVIVRPLGDGQVGVRFYDTKKLEAVSGFELTLAKWKRQSTQAK